MLLLVGMMMKTAKMNLDMMDGFTVAPPTIQEVVFIMDQMDSLPQIKAKPFVKITLGLDTHLMQNETRLFLQSLSILGTLS